MREKGQIEMAKTLETPVFSRGIEILTEKYGITAKFLRSPRLDSYIKYKNLITKIFFNRRMVCVHAAIFLQTTAQGRKAPAQYKNNIVKKEKSRAFQKLGFFNLVTQPGIEPGLPP